MLHSIKEQSFQSHTDWTTATVVSSGQSHKEKQAAFKTSTQAICWHLRPVNEKRKTKEKFSRISFNENRVGQKIFVQ